MLNVIQRAAFLVFGALLFTGMAVAQDIKIIDGKGLTRALKRNLSVADVVVRLVPGSAAAGPRYLRLINVDGLAGDLEGALDGSDSAVFIGVGPGTWQVDGPQAIASVEIQQPKGAR